MKSFYLLSALALIVYAPLFSQSVEEIKLPKAKGAVYLTWGYHKNTYSRSTIHLRDKASDNYDFTLYDAKARDRPDMYTDNGSAIYTSRGLPV